MVSYKLSNCCYEVTYFTPGKRPIKPSKFSHLSLVRIHQCRLSFGWTTEGKSATLYSSCYNHSRRLSGHNFIFKRWSIRCSKRGYWRISTISSYFLGSAGKICLNGMAQDTTFILNFFVLTRLVRLSLFSQERRLSLEDRIHLKSGASGGYPDGSLPVLGWRICKRLRIPGSIPPAYVAWWAGTTSRFVVPIC